MRAPLRFLALLAALLAAQGSGCLPKPVNREELAKQVAKQDPSFSSVLEKYRTLKNRISTYERELAVKKGTIEGGIERLRGELQAATQAVKKKAAETKRLMDPERQHITVSLALAEEQLKTTQHQRMSVGRRMVQLRKAIKVPAKGTAVEAIATYQAQLNDAVTEAQRLDREIALIKDHVRLLKIKARLIEF